MRCPLFSEGSSSPSAFPLISIYYGIKTGFNDAFIIDQATRDALVAEDPRSAELLRPILRGRDIARYHANWADLWLIDTHNGYDGEPPIDVNEYPAIKAHLDRFIKRLQRRQDKGNTPYNLRNCAYHASFALEKVVWIELVDRGRFAYDESGMLIEATAFMITGEQMKLNEAAPQQLRVDRRALRFFCLGAVSVASEVAEARTRDHVDLSSP